MAESEDFFEQFDAFADEAGPKIIAHWRDVLEGSGVKTVRHTCTACGTTGNVSVPVADPEEVRKIADALRLMQAERAKQKNGGADGGKRSNLILKAREEMTDADLATAIAELEDSLGV